MAIGGNGHIKGMLPVVKGFFLFGALVFGLLAVRRYRAQR